ncbi:MAG: hypothetical protein HOW73_11295 [Polyangiaceae bacterium]|nr:hypothetical protein [Polyangiaceae bacterium]
MRFWPFGKDKEPKDVEFVSRVVSGTTRDGSIVRAKVTVSLQEALTSRGADEIVDDAARGLAAALSSAEEPNALVGQEAVLARDTLARMKPRQEVRGVDVVALHIVSESAILTPRPISSNPPAAHAPISSRPPSGGSSRPSPPGPRRPSSSSQMLAVRDSRLIPEGASVETAAYAIVPLLRDASTRVLVGILRACDLVIVRGMRLDSSSSDDLGDLVPASTAAPGRFADERRDELSRWEDKLGRRKIDGLRTEASAIVCYFLHTSLTRADVESKVSTALLEAAAHSAFEEEGPLSELPRYLGHAGDPTDELAAKVLSVLKESSDVLGSFTVMLTPVLASLQEDFAFASRQIKLSGVKA